MTDCSIFCFDLYFVLWSSSQQFVLEKALVVLSVYWIQACISQNS